MQRLRTDPGMTWDQNYERKTVNIRVYGGRIRSNLHRMIDRRERQRQWRDYHGTRRPRIDEEIVVAALLREMRRKERDATPVGRHEPKLQYAPDPSGPGATWFVTIRCLVARNEYERAYFPTITRLPSDWRTFTYMEFTER